MAQALPSPTMPATFKRAGAHAALVAAAVDDGGDLHPRILAADVQRANALRAVHLMSGDRHEVDEFCLFTSMGILPTAWVASVWKIMPRSRHSLPISRERLHHADFVVRGHDRNQDRLVVHGALQFVEIDETIFLHRQVSNAVAVLLKALAGIEHGLVLGDRGDDVVALLAVHLGDAFDGEVVALGSAGGEDDFFRGGADQLGDALASCLHAFFAGPAE